MGTVRELRRGIELVRRRGDTDQSVLLEAWLTVLLVQYGDNILAFDANAAQAQGRLRVPSPGHEIDKPIAATALVDDLTQVTRNTGDFDGTGMRLTNPFVPAA